MARQKKPTVLDLLFGFGLTSGLFLAIQIYTGVDVSETGIVLTVVSGISNAFGIPVPWLIPTLSIILPIASIAITAIHVKTAIEHKHQGVFVTGSGFFGIFSLVLGSVYNTDSIMYFGLILLIAGMAITGIYRPDK